MSEKLYLSTQGQLEDSFKLGSLILKSGFKPKFIIAIWRGGAPIGIAVQEILEYCGIKTDHIAIRTSSYSDINKRADQVRVHGLNYLVKNISHTDPLLIVDDVFDTGLTIDAVIKTLRDRAKLNTPDDIRVAVPWYKPSHNRTEREPDYYLHTTERWIKFPFSLEGLTIDEIKQNRPSLFEILAPVITSR
ncbi:MAG: phosphoribosyltransferase family protein [Gammaproteobacteria bacterium]|nr:phosphoribosyltransferase family protein [Gammaproteobacteria bacterium]